MKANAGETNFHATEPMKNLAANMLLQKKGADGGREESERNFFSAAEVSHTSTIRPKKQQKPNNANRR